MTNDVNYRVPSKLKRAAHDSGPRQVSSIDLVVIHSTEGGTAASVAAMFSLESAIASTHLVVDDDECFRMVPDLVIPWGAKGANHDGLHVELCGWAKWSREQWLAREPTLERAAFKCAKWAWQYKIPRRWLTVEELGAGKRGFTTHVDVNAAFKQGSHWDPGPGFPGDAFLTLVKKWYADIVDERTK